MTIPPSPFKTHSTENNSKRVGWNNYFMGYGRDDSPFPPARADLKRNYQIGWDAAEAYKKEHR
jgi:hypothetical protein